MFADEIISFRDLKLMDPSESTHPWATREEARTLAGKILKRFDMRDKIYKVKLTVKFPQASRDLTNDELSELAHDDMRGSHDRSQKLGNVLRKFAERLGILAPNEQVPLGSFSRFGKTCAFADKDMEIPTSKSSPVQEAQLLNGSTKYNVRSLSRCKRYH